MPAPLPAKAGERVSASFLNFLLQQVTMESGLNSGSFSDGGAIHQHGDSAYFQCDFIVWTENILEKYSLFKIKKHATLNRLQVTTADDSDARSGYYTTLSDPVAADQNFRPTELNIHRLYRLYVDGTITAGDFAKPKAGTYKVEKGGSTFLCLLAPSTDPAVDPFGLFLYLPSTSAELALGFVVNNDILARSAGEVDIIEKDDILTGTIVNVYNPHDVTFYKENTTPGEEHPADRVILFDVVGYPEPVIFPFLLSPCDELDPDFVPVDV